MKSAPYLGLLALLIVGGGVLAADDGSQQIIEHGLGIPGSHGGELKEVKVWGFYTRENWEEEQEVEDYLRAMDYLKKGDSVRENFVHLRLGEERYNRSGQLFCPQTTDEETKNGHPVINPDLRVRLYGEAGNILSEDFLRDKAPHNTKRSFPKNTTETAYEWQVIAYVPYHEEGVTLKLVRLENEKELFLEQLEFHSLQKLKREIEEKKFYAYIPTDDGCFLSPPLR